MVRHWKKVFGEETQQEDRELFGEPDLVGVIRGSRLKWAEKIPKITYESLPEEIRPIVKPRARCKYQVHKDMRKIGLEEEDARGSQWRRPASDGVKYYRHTTNNRTFKDKQSRRFPSRSNQQGKGRYPFPLNQRTADSPAGIITCNSATAVDVWLIRRLLDLTSTLTRLKLIINVNKTYNLSSKLT